MTYIFFLETGFSGCDHEEEIDLYTEGMSADEEKAYVDEEFNDWMWNHIAGSWARKK